MSHHKSPTLVVRVTDSTSIFPAGKINYGVAAVEIGSQQQATGMSHLSGFESAAEKRNGNYQKVIPISWSE